MDLLAQLITFFAVHGYLAVLAALLLCGMGLPLPEDITLVAGGVIAGLGYVNVHLMFLVALAGVIGGDLIMFFAGRFLGPRLVLWRWTSRLLTRRRYAKARKQFEVYGNRLLFTARFLPGMRSAVFVTAGMTRRVSVWRFLLFDGSAALISVPVWVYLGFLGADNHEWLVKWMHRGQTGLLVVLAVLILIIGVFWWRRRRHHSHYS